MNRNWDMKHIPRVKQPSKLPIAFSPDQVQQIFSSTQNFKHKTMLVTCYSSGLHVGELMNLKPTDILPDTMQIRVRSGKGSKERYTILSQVNLELLRVYFKRYRPKVFLFENDRTHKPLTTRTIQLTFQERRKALGLHEDTTIHSLRHSFATHILPSGFSKVRHYSFLANCNKKTKLKKCQQLLRIIPSKKSADYNAIDFIKRFMDKNTFKCKYCKSQNDIVSKSAEKIAHNSS